MEQQLGQEWVNHKTKQQAADLAEQARVAELRESRTRAAAAGEFATALTDIIGYEKDSGSRGDVFDSRISSPVEIGKLPDVEGSENKYGFARVAVYYETEWVTDTVKGLFFKRDVQRKVKTDHIEEIGVHFYAGNEDGSNLEHFASSRWCIPGDDTVKSISIVENDLSMIAELVGYRPGVGAEV